MPQFKTNIFLNLKVCKPGNSAFTVLWLPSLGWGLDGTPAWGKRRLFDVHCCL